MSRRASIGRVVAAIMAMAAVSVAGCGGAGGGGGKLSTSAGAGTSTSGAAGGGGTGSGTNTGSGAGAAAGPSGGASGGPVGSVGGKGGGGPGAASNTLYYTEDFEGGAPGFQVAFGGSSPFAIGVPAFGPAAAHSGTRCLAVTLAADYAPNLLAVAATPAFSLVGASAPVLVIEGAFDIEPGVDCARVCIVGAGGALTEIEPFRGYSRARLDKTLGAGFNGLSGRQTPPAWVEDRFDLSAFAGQPSVQVAFVFESNGFNADARGFTAAFAGWFVDDIRVGEPGAVGDLSAPFRPQPVAADDFEGASLFALAPGTAWEIAAPLAGVGPGAPHSGRLCAATSVTRFVAPTGGARQGRYPSNVGANGTPPDRLALAAPLQLAGARGAVLVFDHAFDFESTYDGGHIVVAASPQGPWTPLEPREGYPHVVSAFLIYNFPAPADGYTGKTVGWHRASIDLTPALATLGPTLYLAFEWASDDSNFHTFAGWYVDDVAVYAD